MLDFTGPLADRARSAYRFALGVGVAALGPERIRVVEAQLRFRMALNLDQPRSLAEKVSWLEFRTDQAMASTLSDKIAVRDYVSERGLKNMLIPVCGGPWDSPEDLDFSGLPRSFVMKAAHGSGMNLVCSDLESLDSRLVCDIAKRWLRQPYPRAKLEPHYLDIPRRVYCEEMLSSPDGLRDYKVHCLNGEPAFILVVSQRGARQEMNLYDLDWHPLPGLRSGIAVGAAVRRPANLDQMIHASRVLAEGLPFVRVDLYDVGDRSYFGELTFSPGGGLFPSFDLEMQEYWGARLEVPVA